MTISVRIYLLTPICDQNTIRNNDLHVINDCFLLVPENHHKINKSCEKNKTRERSTVVQNRSFKNVTLTILSAPHLSHI